MSNMSQPEINEVILASAIASSFSIFGVIFVFLTYTFITDIRSIPTIKFVLCLSFADLILTISGLIETAPSADVNETLCSILGLFNQFGRISSLLWTSVFAYSLYNVLKTNRLNLNHFNRYLTICFIIPLISIFIPLIGGWYGNASIYCWISSTLNKTTETILTVCFYYGWFPIAVIFNIVCYSKAIILLRKNAATEESKASFYQLLLYPLILVMCWSIAFVDRYEIIMNVDNSFLRIAHVFMVQIQGFLNALAYGINYAVRSAIKSKWKMLFQHRSISDFQSDSNQDNYNGTFEFKEKKKPLAVLSFS